GTGANNNGCGTQTNECKASCTVGNWRNGRFLSIIRKRRISRDAFGVFILAKASSVKSDDRKSFVLDTNVLLHNAGSLFMFADNEVIIPFVVLEELDQFKKQN